MDDAGGIVAVVVVEVERARYLFVSLLFRCGCSCLNLLVVLAFDCLSFKEYSCPVLSVSVAC